MFIVSSSGANIYKLFALLTLEEATYIVLYLTATYITLSLLVHINYPAPSVGDIVYHILHGLLFTNSEGGAALSILECVVFLKKQ